MDRARVMRKKVCANSVSDVVVSISGLVVEYVVAIDVTRVLFPADAFLPAHGYGQQHACYILDPRM